MILKCIMILTTVTVFAYILYSEISFRIEKHNKLLEDKKNGNIND